MMWYYYNKVVAAAAGDFEAGGDYGDDYDYEEHVVLLLSHLWLNLRSV